MYTIKSPSAIVQRILGDVHEKVRNWTGKKRGTIDWNLKRNTSKPAKWTWWNSIGRAHTHTSTCSEWKQSNPPKTKALNERGKNIDGEYLITLWLERSAWSKKLISVLLVITTFHRMKNKWHHTENWTECIERRWSLAHCTYLTRRAHARALARYCLGFIFNRHINNQFIACSQFVFALFFQTNACKSRIFCNKFSARCRERWLWQCETERAIDWNLLSANSPEWYTCIQLLLLSWIYIDNEIRNIVIHSTSQIPFFFQYLHRSA